MSNKSVQEAVVFADRRNRPHHLNQEDSVLAAEVSVLKFNTNSTDLSDDED